MRLRVRVPATAANLGAGFDCLGLALDLHNEVSVDTEGAPGISWEGEGASELPRDGTDLVSKAMGHLAAVTGKPLPPLAVRSVNSIPLERGLGSSAAAVVAGIALAARLLGDDDPPTTKELLAAASAVEGHPDNVAAALLGGLTIAYAADGAVRLEPAGDLRPVILLPDERFSTAEARAALAPQVERSDAVFNLQRSALAVVALTERTDLLAEALRDRLHQQQRLKLLPAVRAIFDELTDAGIPACLSGAGPSLLAFDTGKPFSDPGEGWRILRLSTDLLGAQVEEID